MSRRNGLRAAHLKAVKMGCPRPVYRSTTRISRIDPAIVEEQKREQAQKDLEQLFLSRAKPNLKRA
jgi:hypothetical protein